jgi:hypothetical protein
MLEETSDREEIIERVAALDIGKAAAMARMAWPARRCARWMVGAAQPGVVGDLGYLQHRLHRLLRFHVEHGYRAAPAALESRRSKPGIITATDLTKGRIDPLGDFEALGAGGQEAARCRGFTS